MGNASQKPDVYKRHDSSFNTSRFDHRYQDLHERGVQGTPQPVHYSALLISLAFPAAQWIARHLPESEKSSAPHAGSLAIPLDESV